MLDELESALVGAGVAPELADIERAAKAAAKAAAREGRQAEAAPLSTGQTISAHLDPVSVNVSVGYRF